MSIDVCDLRKSYGSFEAVKGLSFNVPTGAVFAFLGSNGAGKSTTIGCITTTLSATSGRITVDGLDVATQADKVRHRIGVVFQQSILDPLLTVEENLASRAGFYGIPRARVAPRVKELTSLIGLDSFLTRPYGVLSGGQKRRADIARALVHRPQVLFLDEPTAGLDPQSREQIWGAIHALRKDHGVTIFLTTHYMEETERADNVCIINAGQTVAEGTPSFLRSKYSSSVLTIRGQDTEAIAHRLRAAGASPRIEGAGVVVPTQSAQQAVALLGDVPFDDFEYRHGTMDDVFLAVTSKEML